VTTTRMTMSRETDLAWAAGFIDGEGTFYFKDSGSFGSSIILRVGQCEPTTLRRLQATFGGKVYGPYKPSSPLSKKVRYEFRLNGTKLRGVIKELWPYLSGPKRKQYNEAVAKKRQSLI